MAPTQSRRPRRERLPREDPRDYHRVEFARRLRELREQSDPRMTQEDLASASGLGYRKIVDLERGKAAVELDVIQALGHVFGLPPLLWTILPDVWDDKDFEDQLMESVARVGLRKKLDGLNQDETWQFVMNVSQLPADEVSVINRWVLDHVLALRGPQATFISRRVAEAMTPGARRRRAKRDELLSNDLQEGL